MATPPPSHTNIHTEPNVTSWIITATIEDVHGEPLQVAEQLVDDLPAGAATVDGRRLHITFALDHPDTIVSPDLIATARDHLPGGRVVELHVRTEQLLDDDLSRPAVPALVGISEAAEILGVTRQRAHAMAQTAGFPPPVADLAAGPVFLESAVRAFAAKPRRAGRPARTA